MPRKEEQNQTVTQLSGYQLQATDKQTDRLTNSSVRRKAPKDNKKHERVSHTDSVIESVIDEFEASEE